MSKKNLKCTVCDRDAIFYNNLQEVTLYYCKNCKHFFTDLNSIKNKENYSQEYFDERHANWFKNPNFHLFDYIFNQIKSVRTNNLSILDAGCGDGNLLRYICQKSQNFKLTGIDYKKNSEEKGIKYFSGDIFDTEFDEQFDIIISVAVIEHIWDVQKYMKRLSKLCKDGGLIITMTPNNSSLLYGFSRMIYKLGIKAPMEGLYDKHHLNHFSQHSLEYLCKNNSLDVIENNITQFNIESLSLPKTNILMTIIYKLGLSAVFILEKFFGKKHMQTITLRKVN